MAFMVVDEPNKVERWQPENSSASAYLRGGRIMLHGDCITTIGNIACEPYLTLPATSGDEEIGAKLLMVLAAAKVAEPPADVKAYLKAQQKKILAAAGVRSWVKLSESTTYCSVLMKPQEMSITPSRNDGRGFGFLPAELTVKLPSGSTPDRVGQALREGFSRCIKKE
jgi:hypothetical protein